MSSTGEEALTHGPPSEWNIGHGHTEIKKVRKSEDLSLSTCIPTYFYHTTLLYPFFVWQLKEQKNIEEHNVTLSSQYEERPLTPIQIVTIQNVKPDE